MIDKEYMVHMFDSLGEIEKNIVYDLIRRIYIGQGVYGVFKRTDKRDFIRESSEEILDALVYVSAMLYMEKSK